MIVMFFKFLKGRYNTRRIMTETHTNLAAMTTEHYFCPKNFQVPFICFCTLRPALCKIANTAKIIFSRNTFLQIDKISLFNYLRTRLSAKHVREALF